MPTPADQPRPDARGKPVVACQSLTKVFKDFWMRSRARAVDDLTFTIEPHEVFGLLGPNGSGKSTTIKLILGLLHKTAGRLAVFGMPPSDVRIKRRIGYLPEESYLYPFLNARETLDYYAKLFELDRAVRLRRIDELVDMVGLGNAQFRPVREYSKGMQRRLGIAQALINDPDFLILDEPTTGLDPIGTRQIKDLILELGRRGKTVLLSSHLLSDVEDCVDRMIILYGGKKRAEGTVDELLVSQTRTVIETDALSDPLVADIDRLLRERAGSGVLRVSHPRQKLEELFLDIVEKARAERLETSGALHGGQTASFLRGPDEQDPESLINRLVAGREEPTPTEPSARAARAGEPQAPGADDNVVAALLDDAYAPEPPASPAAPAPSAPERATAPAKAPSTANVDLGVIGSLLSPGDEPAKGPRP